MIEPHVTEMIRPPPRLHSDAQLLLPFHIHVEDTGKIVEQIDSLLKSAYLLLVIACDDPTLQYARYGPNEALWHRYLPPVFSSITLVILDYSIVENAVNESCLGSIAHSISILFLG